MRGIIKKKNLSVLISMLLLSTSLMIGCSSSSSDGTATVKDNLTVAMGSDARSVDPHSAGDASSVNALMNVVETLVQYDEKREIVPMLAESWEQVDDVTYKFNLRHGVKFHNGEEMKASDVVYSFKRALSPAGAKVQYIMNVIDPDGFEIIDDYTVIIKTKEPFSPFISYLPYIGASIISEKYYTENTEVAPNHPIGTGPLKFVDWKKGNELTYEKNDEYWGTPTAYEELTIRIIPENNSRMIELETGAVDIAYDVAPNDFTRVQESSDMELLTTPSTTVTLLYLNTQKPNLDNVKVRQAIDYAIDEKSIMKVVRRDSAQYTPGLITPEQLYFDKENPDMYYDVEKAKQLMSESGVSTPIKMSLYVSDNQVRIDMATIIQTQLKEIGIEIDIKVLEAATFNDVITTGEHDLCILGWGAVGFNDPDNNLYGPIHSSGIPNNNYSFYSNPELDKLLDEQRILPNGPERETAVVNAQRLIREETPYIALDNALQAVGVRSNVKGFNVTPAASHPLSKVYFE